MKQVNSIDLARVNYSKLVQTNLNSQVEWWFREFSWVSFWVLISLLSISNLHSSVMHVKCVAIAEEWNRTPPSHSWRNNSVMLQ